jgi:hypothetical protein
MIGPKVFAVRWLLLCALAFGVVGMHHLASMCHGEDHAEVMLVAMSSPTTMIAPAAPSDDCCGAQLASGHGVPAGTHDLMHVCLAILAAGLVLGALLARWRRAGPGPGLLPKHTAVRRRPPSSPPGSAAILTSLCVLRL